MQQDRLHVELQLDLNGEREMIVQTLSDLSAALKEEVEQRAARHAALGDGAAQALADAATFSRSIGELSGRLASIFTQVETTLTEAASPSGSPEMFRLGYATFLERLLGVEKTLWSHRAPSAFAQTQREYRNMVRALYDQVAAWPATLASNAHAVAGNSSRTTLRVDYDLHPVLAALKAGAAAASR